MAPDRPWLRAVDHGNRRTRSKRGVFEALQSAYPPIMRSVWHEAIRMGGLVMDDPAEMAA
ncbi:hypothetical protein DCS_02049 [Drechmeria coniospora]|uniref:Uncharacterized protein n=1 Tax=Drechmeria coniospora TaxID=98403 RepID=A0A151GUX5_DRECN|nr:hypothetical protein DCS_02049 [Drechmeria coniospora]KYK60909.1 hypothetical protein DCS_02049 [Drechmeria coniospora]